MANEPLNYKGKIKHQWSFPEYEKHQRSIAWWFWFIVIGGALIVYALVTVNFLFALIIIITAGIILLHHYNEPQKVNFTIYENGIELSRRFYKWSELKKFWLVYEPPEVKKLYFSFQNALKPAMVIPLGKQNPLKIRATLLDLLEEDLEKEQEESSETLSRLLKL